MTIKKKMIRNRKKIMSTLYVYMSMHTKITVQGFLLQEVH